MTEHKKTPQESLEDFANLPDVRQRLRAARVLVDQIDSEAAAEREDEEKENGRKLLEETERQHEREINLITKLLNSTPAAAPAPLMGAEKEDTPAERRAKLDITAERGARRRILENWNDIESEYGPHADARHVLRILKRDVDETPPALKTVQNHMSALRRQKLLP